MKLISTILKANKKTCSEFINYVCDGTRNHYLDKYKGQSMIKYKNGNQQKKLYIDKRLMSILDKFLNE